MDRTALGYEIRAVGLNPDAAETAGISKAKVTIVALCISGCIAGLAGASHVLGVDRRLINGFSNDYGFSGISVAALAADSPVGVIFAGIVFGALRVLKYYKMGFMAGWPDAFFDMLPFLITALILVITSIRGSKGAHIPASLGVNYFREER